MANTQSFGLETNNQLTRVMQNHTRAGYDILRPLEPKQTNSTQALMTIAQGKCHQVYGISDFAQNSRTGAEKPNIMFRTAFGSDKKCFNRVNGEFTEYANQI